MMVKKTIVSLLAVAMMAGGSIAGVASAVPGKDLRIIPVVVNGQKVKFPDTEPYINTDGRTMVPVRFVSEKLGATVKWDEKTNTAILTFGSKQIRMSIGSKTVTVDGVKQELDTAAEKYEGRTMVPLRFVSEVLGSKVEWDDPAHSVKVTDVKYQAKIAAGGVKLDPWGREYSKTWDANWMRLTDLEKTKFYSFYGKKRSRSFVEPKDLEVFKEYADAIGGKVRNWYEAQLNVDYRTVSKEALTNVFMKNASGTITKNSYRRDGHRAAIDRYVDWVKKNKVIVKGYADPELTTFFESGDLLWVPTRFKFKIISAEDTSQTLLDNWDATGSSDSYKMQKNVWYEGYALVSLESVVASDTFSPDYGLRQFENMFYLDSYFYEISK
ncbi:copper amine oxidase N-terminal domain-containing protein [Paenibacillus sp. GCM10027627]|uniref:copper amine oxidase N-terminal domain-containing protein n=1 Tax=unclassified Paenibacillus TaxID=185978 RepID=UPI003627EAEB